MRKSSDSKEWTTGEAMRYFLMLLKRDSDNFKASPEAINNNWNYLIKEITVSSKH